MTYSSNIHPTPIVTIYTYIVKGLYKVTILSLLRLSIYTKLLYASWVIAISNNIYYPYFRIFDALHFFRVLKSALRQIRKSAKSHLLSVFTSLQILKISILVVPINRDISPSSN